MAGYSGTPLAKKLGIKASSRLILVGEVPRDFEAMIEPLPEGVDIVRGLRGRFPVDTIVVFTKRRGELERRIVELRSRMQQNGGLWIGWPKKASRVDTDLTEGIVREIAIANGLVDNKVCAIDETWSGLRLVIRLADRVAPESGRR
jgi:hypothetical protein